MNYLKIMINHVLDVFTPYFCADINDVIIMFLTFGNHQLKKISMQVAKDIYFMVKLHFS